MSDKQAQLIETLFHTARDLNPEERSKFLDEKCGRDASLRRTLETLLREDSTPGPLDVAISESLATTLSSGMVIGPYEVVSIAGIGGMGQVYRAVDRRLRRDVAIKALPAEFTHDQERMERLRGEATVLASLNHPNIAGIHDVIEEEGEPHCLVLEFVPGATLAELLAGGGFDIHRTVRIAHQIATALEAAHDKGIVHRDLKPSNIKLTPEAKVKVLDFGLARAFGDDRTDPARLADHRTGASGLAGTPSYMSPEQAQAVPVDQRADIWSFGCIVYELITGQKAFGGRTAQEALSSVLHNEPDWTLLPSDTPSELLTLLHQCLQKDVANRLSDSSRLRRTLEELERKQNALTPQPDSAAARTVPRSSGRRIPWKAAAVLLLVVAGATSGVTWWNRSRPPGLRRSQVAEANRYFAMAMEAVGNGQFDRWREFLLKALEADAKFAAAREIYAFSLWSEVDAGISNNPDLLYQAEGELQQALKDDSQSADAHAHLGKVYYYLGRKEQLLAEVEKALNLDPANREGKMGLVFYHQLNGDYDKAQEILQEIISGDPTFTPAQALFADNLRQLGDYQGAIREFRKIFDLGPPNPGAGQLLALAYQSAGDHAQSRRLIDAVAPPERGTYIFRLLWALQLALEGKRDEALREMDEDLQDYARLVYYSLFAAEIYAVLGETDKALYWLEQGIRAGDERVEWFERDPHLKSIRNDPRFKRMLAPLRGRRATP